MAQLVEYRTGITEVTGSKPVEALIFSGFFFPIASIGKFTARIILHFHLQHNCRLTYMNYMLYFMYIYTSHVCTLCRHKEDNVWTVCAWTVLSYHLN